MRGGGDGRRGLGVIRRRRGEGTGMSAKGTVFRSRGRRGGGRGAEEGRGVDGGRRARWGCGRHLSTVGVA